MEIKTASNCDLKTIVDIYNQAITLKQSTSDLTPLKVSDRQQWFDEHIPDKYPLWVASSDDEIMGWCSISPYRPGRMALKFTMEISYYIHEKHRRKGVASSLITHAISQIDKLHIKTLIAILLDRNIPSIKILEKFGFERWGFLPDVAVFDGINASHIFFGKRFRK
jgi:L-amino acid N-acyltransferase YncA